ncbi:MAG: lysophospholipid acyltransferase family protein [Deltaproteobacteria bacterium]|nr:lysophospholipid acyltransferase family protein [Deltaproteobacteria bacterium]
MKQNRQIRTILGLFRIIPLFLRRLIFCGAALLFYRLSERHRLIVLHNLRWAFPEKGSGEIGRIARGAYRNIGILAAEFFEIFSMDSSSIERWVEIEGLENYQAAKAKNKGVLFYTAHLGNWEIMAACFGFIIDPVHIVYRPLDNKILDGIVAYSRSYTGNSLIAKGGAAAKIYEILRNNENVGVLLDQNVSWKTGGVFVPFFGRPACTTTRLATIALTSGAPVIPGFSIRKTDGTYKIIFGKEVPLIRTGNNEFDLYENTKAFTAIIEKVVHDHPEQWFWLHQRWKTKQCQVGTPY